MQKEFYDLLKIGLTEGEAKVYLALIELGSTTVGPVVKKAQVAYSNVYDILDRLTKKGIVTLIIKEKTKYFQAVNPSNLIDYLEKKEKELKEQREELKKILPDIEKLQENLPKEEAELFIGKKGLRSAYEKLFANRDKKAENLFFYKQEKEYAQEADIFYLGLFPIIEKIPSRGIVDNDYRLSEAAKESIKRQIISYKFVNFPIPGNMEVCGNKMLIISWQKPIIGVLINSKSVADNFKEYFESVWKAAKKIEKTIKTKPK
jgi:HTH-type transcriptional regulator, sugar sensing transcriptional regulator